MSSTADAAISQPLRVNELQPYYRLKLSNKIVAAQRKDKRKAHGFKRLVFHKVWRKMMITCGESMIILMLVQRSRVQRVSLVIAAASPPSLKMYWPFPYLNFHPISLFSLGFHFSSMSIRSVAVLTSLT